MSVGLNEPSTLRRVCSLLGGCAGISLTIRYESTSAYEVAV